MKKLRSILMPLAALTAASFTPLFGATTITLEGVASDAAIRGYISTGLGAGLDAATAETIRSGSSGNGDNRGFAAIFVFQLPDDLTADQIASASFTANVVSYHNGSNTYKYNHDLWAIDVPRVSSDVVLADYFVGVAPEGGVVDGAGHNTSTLLQTDFLINTDGVTTATTGSVTTDEDGSAALTSFVQSVIDTDGGKYIFLRINPDWVTPAGNTSGPNIATAENANAALRPFITLQIIPEPATAAGLTGALILVLALGARHRKV